VRFAVIFAFVVSALASRAVPTPADFPFDYCNGLIWLEVSSPQSSQPLRFLLDSGAAVSVLNMTIVERLNLRRGQPVKVKGVESGATGYWPQSLTANVGEVRLPEQFLAVDLSELSQACACSVDGLLGADFFRERAVQIDFINHRIRLLPATELTANSEIVPLLASKRGLRVALEVNGEKPSWLRLDTGCASSLEWVTANAPSPLRTSGTTIGLSQTSIPQSLTSVRLGNTTLTGVPTGVHRRQIFAQEAGLLGNGILDRFSRVTIDVRKNRLILEPR